MNTIYYLIFILFLWSFSSNTAAGQPAAVPQAKLTLSIVNKFGEADIQLDQAYTTFHGDIVTFTKFKYYLSHIELTATDGTIWKQPQSYHLIEVNEETTATTEIILDGLPQGTYTHISFAIGIDSISNHSGDQEGVLDPDYGMFWMWETGYVFFKTEGTYQTISGNKGAMVYHIGREACYRKVNLKLPPGRLQVAQNKTSQLQIIADVKKLFGGFAGAAIDLKGPPDNGSISVMGGEKALKVADNYAQMFAIRPKTD